MVMSNCHGVAMPEVARIASISGAVDIPGRCELINSFSTKAPYNT